MVYLTYDRGTILIKGNIRVPNATWDSRNNCYRALALHYRDIIEYLKNSKIDFHDRVLNLIPCPELKCDIKLRDYQRKALDSWIRAGKLGSIILPTGAGKTFVGIKAIATINAPSIVIVPTLELLNQWKLRLEEELGIEVGVYGGGKHELKAITVATYDSAYIRAEELGNKFKLVIFDEVHHLPAPGYSTIAEFFASPYRLGLTATYEREDGMHVELQRLIGGKVFEVSIKELSGKHLAEYELRIIHTELTPEEKIEYERNYKAYLNYIREKKIDLQELIMRSGRDKKAREALLARHRARTIALNSESKLLALKRILELHRGEKIIIFTEHNSLVYRISKRFLIPFITHKTKKQERQRNLENFKKGIYNAIVTSKVLDEGIDVPEASIGVILSGSGSTREYRQRLGRILRKKEGKKAILYEIVSKRTTEVGTLKRRHMPVWKKIKNASK